MLTKLFNHLFDHSMTTISARGLRVAADGLLVLPRRNHLVAALAVLVRLGRHVFVCHVKGHHNLPTYSPLLKNACVRRVVLDMCFPLNIAWLWYLMAAGLREKSLHWTNSLD